MQLRQVLAWAAALIFGLGYALLSHICANASQHSLFGAVVAVLPMLGLALLLAWRARHRQLPLALWLVVCIALYLARTPLIEHYNWVFLLEHVGSYSLLCASFGVTLRGGNTPMISRFAALVQGELSPALTRYTRTLTWVWTGYFGGVAGLSLLLFWLAPVAIWSSFAFLLGPPLLALMFAGEYAVRCWLLPPADRAGPLAAIQAYRQSSAHPSKP